MLPAMYAKLFSRIAQSSLMEEEIETRYCFMMLLAIADSSGDVIGTDVALARTVNLPLDTFKRCISALMEPDPNSNSQVHEGRRIIPSDSGRGYFIVNYTTYRQIKTADEKKAYMREYMKQYRKAKSGKDVTAVKNCKTVLGVLAQGEGEGEAEGKAEVDGKKEEANRDPGLAPPAHTPPAKPEGVAKKAKKPTQTDDEWISGIEAMDAYKPVNVRQELGKAQLWCSNKNRQCTRIFFTNWLNRALGNVKTISTTKTPEDDKYRKQYGW